MLLFFGDPVANDFGCVDEDLVCRELDGQIRRRIRHHDLLCGISYETGRQRHRERRNLDAEQPIKISGDTCRRALHNDVRRENRIAEIAVNHTTPDGHLGLSCAKKRKKREGAGHQSEERIQSHGSTGWIQCDFELTEFQNNLVQWTRFFFFTRAPRIGHRRESQSEFDRQSGRHHPSTICVVSGARAQRHH